MVRSLVCSGVLLLVAQAAQADPPPGWLTERPAEGPTEQEVEDLVELRQQVGERGAVVADDREFAETLRNSVRPLLRSWGAKLVPGSPEQPQETPKGFDHRFQQQQQPAYNVWAPAGHDSLESVWGAEIHPSQNSAWGATRVEQAGAYERPGPPPGPPHGGPPSPKHLLRRAASELDRLANDLEMAELYKDADALRETAGELRQTARDTTGERRPPQPPSNAQPYRDAYPPRGDQLRDDAPRQPDRREERRRRDTKKPDRPDLPAQGVHGGPSDPGPGWGPGPEGR